MNIKTEVELIEIQIISIKHAITIILEDLDRIRRMVQ